jgi:hypothetical protein
MTTDVDLVWLNSEYLVEDVIGFEGGVEAVNEARANSQADEAEPELDKVPDAGCAEGSSARLPTVNRLRVDGELLRHFGLGAVGRLPSKLEDVAGDDAVSTTGPSRVAAGGHGMTR